MVESIYLGSVIHYATKFMSTIKAVSEKEGQIMAKFSRNVIVEVLRRLKPESRSNWLLVFLSQTDCVFQ